MVENSPYPNVVDFIYEYDEKGRRVLVRSMEADKPALVRFTNKTSRPVDIWWRNYRGTKKFYKKVDPGGIFDANTFITHPWEFTDSDTREHFVVCNKIIFRPPPVIGGMPQRTNWNITVRVSTLRHTALLALGLRLAPNPGAVRSLGLPYILADELLELILALRTVPFLPRE